MKSLQVRVYGLWVNAKGEVLISDERHRDMNFTKFPGGGLEPDEGVQMPGSGIQGRMRRNDQAVRVAACKREVGDFHL